MTIKSRTRSAGAAVLLAAALVGGSAVAAGAYSDFTTVKDAASRNVSDGVCSAAVWTAGTTATTRSTTSSGCTYIKTRGYIVSGGTGYYSSWVTLNNPGLNGTASTGMVTGLVSGYHRLQA